MPRTKRPHEAVDPRKRPLQRRSRSTVDVILEAAAQVLERDGSATTTTDMIAARAGVSIGSLYQYFPNKDAALLALTQQHAEAARAVLEPLLAEIVTGTPPASQWLQRFARRRRAERPDAAQHRRLARRLPAHPAAADAGVPVRRPAAPRSGGLRTQGASLEPFTAEAQSRGDDRLVFRRLCASASLP